MAKIAVATEPDAADLKASGSVPGFCELGAVLLLDNNPKDHDHGEILTSLQIEGFVDPLVVNAPTKHILGGNGRVMVLRGMKARGEKPPRGVRVSAEGSWLVPVLWVSVPVEKELKIAVALNNLTIRGGWNHALLTPVLQNLAATGDLGGSGFDADDVDAMLAYWNQGMKPPAPQVYSGHEGFDVPPPPAPPAPPEAPEEFKSVDESLDTEFRCPSCGYEWSGKAK